MAIYTNEHLTDLLNNEYEKVRKLEQENQRLKSNFAGYENFQREKQLEQDLQKTREQLIGVTEQLNIAEAVLSVQATKSAFKYFEDKQGEG
jgi:Fe-S cluster assembly scaffold protein SufB